MISLSQHIKRFIIGFTPNILCLFLTVIFFNASKAQHLKVLAQPIQANLYAVNNTVMLKGPSVLSDDNKMVWCGSVVKVHDSAYYMFYSTWSCGPDSLTFYNSWVLESEIAIAFSKFPDKDFQFKKIVLRGRRNEGDTTAWDAQMVHNPHIQKFNDKYYLYYVGSYDPGKQVKGSPGENLSKRDRVQQMQQIGVIEFASIDDALNGNFVRPNKPILSASTRVKKDNIIFPSPAGTMAKPNNIVVVNPSVVYRPSDKKYLLFFKGNWYDPVWRGVHGLAIADNPTGPFVTQDATVFDIKLSDGKIASAEDPFVWYNKQHKKFYAVLKDFTGKLTGKEPSLALLESETGIEWRQAKHSTFLNKEVKLLNGSLIKLYHLERPFLLLDDDGMPIVFYGAACINSPGKMKTTGTFNVHIPLIPHTVKK